jgi:hypothetical protein
MAFAYSARATGLPVVRAVVPTTGTYAGATYASDLTLLRNIGSGSGRSGRTCCFDTQTGDGYLVSSETTNQALYKIPGNGSADSRQAYGTSNSINSAVLFNTQIFSGLQTKLWRGNTRNVAQSHTNWVDYSTLTGGPPFGVSIDATQKEWQFKMIAGVAGAMIVATIFSGTHWILYSGTTTGGSLVPSSVSITGTAYASDISTLQVIDFVSDPSGNFYVLACKGPSGPSTGSVTYNIYKLNSSLIKQWQVTTVGGANSVATSLCYDSANGNLAIALNTFSGGSGGGSVTSCSIATMNASTGAVISTGSAISGATGIGAIRPGVGYLYATLKNGGGNWTIAKFDSSKNLVAQSPAISSPRLYYAGGCNMTTFTSLNNQSFLGYPQLFLSPFIDL